MITVWGGSIDKSKEKMLWDYDREVKIQADDVKPHSSGSHSLIWIYRRLAICFQAPRCFKILKWTASIGAIFSPMKCEVAGVKIYSDSPSLPNLFL